VPLVADLFLGVKNGRKIGTKSNTAVRNAEEIRLVVNENKILKYKI
jgi:hypothetical protein